ncbi:acetoin dehydrogenase [Mycolicibacillus koreensis]|nr:acetoin dehydrogenase [Mycolicibacillus koreensis]
MNRRFFAPRETFAGKITVVTGAGSGIGRALATNLAGRGATVAITDVDEAGLAETAELIRAAGGSVASHRLDVTDHRGASTYAEEIHARFGAVHQLYNNAGVEHHGDLEHSDLSQIRRVMDINYGGVVNLTKAFLPYLIESGDGHIINVSSLFGLLGIAGQSAYSASKFAVRGLTESLRQEMLAAGHPVQVTCVHPSSVKTAIARNTSVAAGEDAAAVAALYDDKLARISSDRAAQIILRGVSRRRPRVLIGADAYALDVLVRLLGPAYQRGAAALVARVQPGLTAKDS